MSTSAKTLTPEQQNALAKFQAFVGQQAVPKEIPTLTDYQGKTYGGDVLARLAGQISQNLDTSKLRGGAFGVNVGDDTSIGFKASEAKKLLGRMPTASEMVILDMARGLASQGITDISDLGKYKKTDVDEVVSGGEGSDTTQKVTKYIDPATGKEFSLGLGETYTGKGGTHYNVEFDKEGKPKFSTYGRDTSDAGKIMPLLMMATLPFGGVGGLLGGASSTLAGGIASLGIPQAAANIGANALLSGAVQGGISKLAGGDFGKGFRSGVVSGGIGAGVSELGAMTGLDKGLGSFYTPAKSLATSALTAAARGKPFDLGQAVKGAAINYGLNQAIGAGGKELGIDPKQQDALMKFYNFAAPMIAAQRRKP